MQKKKIVTIVICIIAAVLAAVVIYDAVSTSKGPEPYTDTGYVMGSPLTQKIWSDDDSTSSKAASEVLTSLTALENDSISWRIKGSDVYNINHSSGNAVRVSKDTASYISRSLDVCKSSCGRLDITIGTLSTLWGIGTDDAKVPSQKQIDDAISVINYKDLTVNGDLVTSGKGQMLDLGATGKGIACDKARSVLEKTSVKSAVISVGGSILCYGSDPDSKDGRWTIGIRDPSGSENDYCMTASVKGGNCISTSGDYEKVLVENGKTYFHILDPQTGYPVKTNVTSVTVISRSGLLSDALSTACFSEGYGNKSLALLRKYDAEGIFILKGSLKVYATSGIKSSLSVTDDRFTLCS